MTVEQPASERTRASLELLYSISRELTAELDLNELLRRILQLTIEKVGALSGSIIVLDEKGQLTEGAVHYHGDVLERPVETLEDPFERGLAGWVFEYRQAALIPSTLDDDRWLKRSDVEFDGVARSAISVPLMTRDRVVGVLTLVHPQAMHFKEADLTLLQAIADQASIAVENARLFTAEQERQRFASTLQEIARTINSTIEPTQVFSQILEQLERIISYDVVNIFILEQDRLSLVASRGLEDEVVDLGHGFPIDPKLLAVQVLTTRKPMVVTDVQQEDGWLKTDRLPESDRIRGWIGAPLVVRDRAVGVLSVGSLKVGAYDSSAVEVVSVFAGQAATAVANAQLFGVSQRRVLALATLADTARAVTASLDLDEVLGWILKHTMTSMDAEAASVALLDDTTDELEFRFAIGRGAGKMVGIRLEKNKGIAGWVVANSESVVVSNVREDPRFYPEVDERIGFETRMIAAAPIPMQSRTIGVLEAINPRNDIVSQEQVDLLTGIAFLAGSAITRAQLFSETQSARQRYAGLFEDSIDPILITDLSGSITDANRRAETFLQLTLEDLLGKSALKLSIPNADQVADGISRLTPGQTLSSDNQVDHEETDTLPIELHIKRIDIGQQPILQWIMHDITERLELDELRADLTSMIFHDLRAPIGNIISSLEVLQSSAPEEDETFQAVLSIAIRSGRRASRLVESLLDLDRLEAGKAVLDKSQADIGALITEAVEELRPLAEAKGHTLLLDLEKTMPKIEVDADMIRRVLINILDNANKYTRSGGAIIAEAKIKGDDILVSMRDSGPGISTLHQQRIFEKYTRIQQEVRPKGMGLGLAFCRLAVEAHGGSIWVESEEGVGSTFFFTLPV